MNTLELLLHQTRHHYRWLEHASADVDAEAASFRIGERPSIAWIVDHCRANAEANAEAVAEPLATTTGAPDTPALEAGVVLDASAWIALRGRWLTTAETSLERLRALTPEQLELPPRTPILAAFEAQLDTRRAYWSGHVFHMAYHLGQIGSLRAELGLGWWT